MRVRDVRGVVEVEGKSRSWEGIWRRGEWCVCSFDMGSVIYAVSCRRLR